MELAFVFVVARFYKVKHNCFPPGCSSCFVGGPTFVEFTRELMSLGRVRAAVHTTHNMHLLDALAHVMRTLAAAIWRKGGHAGTYGRSMLEHTCVSLYAWVVGCGADLTNLR